jgi:hypothetical protein
VSLHPEISECDPFSGRAGRIRRCPSSPPLASRAAGRQRRRTALLLAENYVDEMRGNKLSERRTAFRIGRRKFDREFKRRLAAISFASVEFE